LYEVVSTSKLKSNRNLRNKSISLFKLTHVGLTSIKSCFVTCPNLSRIRNLIQYLHELRTLVLFRGHGVTWPCYWRSLNNQIMAENSQPITAHYILEINTSHVSLFGPIKFRVSKPIDYNIIFKRRTTFGLSTKKEDR